MKVSISDIVSIVPLKDQEEGGRVDNEDHQSMKVTDSYDRYKEKEKKGYQHERQF